MCRVTLVIALALSSFVVSHAQTPRLVRVQSGPSGKVVGSDFVLDETRNRFVYPQDRTVTVSFEWEWPAGDHVLTATWKRPDGRVASVSPDVKIQTPTPKLTAYWLFEISPNVGAGTWTVEIRIDGQPAASHAFEVVGTEPDKVHAGSRGEDVRGVGRAYPQTGRSGSSNRHEQRLSDRHQRRRDGLPGDRHGRRARN